MMNDGNDCLREFVDDGPEKTWKCLLVNVVYLHTDTHMVNTVDTNATFHLQYFRLQVVLKLQLFILSEEINVT